MSTRLFASTLKVHITHQSSSSQSEVAHFADPAAEAASVLHINIWFPGRSKFPSHLFPFLPPRFASWTLSFEEHPQGAPVRGGRVLRRLLKQTWLALERRGAPIQTANQATGEVRFTKSEEGGPSDGPSWGVVYSHVEVWEMPLQIGLGFGCWMLL